MREEVGKPLQFGKRFLCAALSLLILAALLPNREAYAYTAPDFRDAEFHEAAAMIGDRVKLDVSCLDQGYVAVSAVSNMRLKFQVVHDDATYNYDLPNDGTPTLYPINMGSGQYRFRVMQNGLQTCRNLLGEGKTDQAISQLDDLIRLYTEEDGYGL